MNVASAPTRRVLLVITVVVVTAVVVALALLPGRGSPPQADDAGAQASPSTPASGSPAPQSSSPSSDPAGGARSSADPSDSPSGSSGSGSQNAMAPAPYQEVTPEPAIALSETADFGTGLTLRITDTEAVKGEARGPGEVAGPAVRLRMTAENASGEAIPLDGMTITLTHGRDRTPASSLHTDSEPFTGDLAAGKTARAAYVFSVPAGSRDLVRVTASYTGAAPMVVLAGSAS